MLFLQYVPTEVVETLLIKIPELYEIDDVPLTQEIVNKFYRQLNGPFETLEEAYQDIYLELVERLGNPQSYSGVFTLISKGDEIMCNDVPLILPKMWVCEENVQVSRSKTWGCGFF